ncbi:MAG: acylneuraminate cytidylyltransferase family protein [Chitinophagales bacterium]
MKTLVLITARGGSKGLPGKNAKPLMGQPLILFSLQIARLITTDENICVSTDSHEIIAVVESEGLNVPFVRPAILATDTASSRDVIIHAIEFYRSKGVEYDIVLLLQPTSPFRKLEDVQNMLMLFNSNLDMVVSVKESEKNPYYSLFEENKNGFLKLSKQANFNRRQDCPKVYEYNGSTYVINVKSILQQEIGEFDKVIKYVMDEICSVDVDTPLDWLWAETIIDNKLWENGK